MPSSRESAFLSSGIAAGTKVLSTATAISTVSPSPNWALEMGAPAVIQRNGWTRNSMKIGDIVTVEGSLARDGSKRANARTVTTADGKTLGAASSGDPTTRP